MDRLQQQVVEQEREIEHRVAAVNDLPVDDPQSAVADEDVLRRVVAVDDALLRRQQPVDVRADPAGELGVAALDRAQVWIDALSLERFGAAEVGVGGVQGGKQLPEPRRDRRVSRPVQQERLPRQPGSRRFLHDQRERLRVGVDELRHRARCELRHQLERLGLRHGALPWHEPLVGDAKALERLLDHHAPALAANGEHRARDAAGQLLDVGPVRRLEDAALHEVGRHGGGRQLVAQSLRSQAERSRPVRRSSCRRSSS